MTVAVTTPAQLKQALGRANLTRLGGRPFALVNTHHGLLALAFGPAEVPPRLVVTVVVDLDTDPLQIPHDEADGQPGWLLFDINRQDPAHKR